MSFPADFVWGAATSSYQIEGGAEKHGRGESVWDAFCRVPGAIIDGSTGAVACDHVNRYREDVGLMKRLGLGAYRLSLSWSRVMPDGAGAVSESGLAFYDRLIDELLGAGIDPWVTLFHWDLPTALHRAGGWLNPASPYWFEEYTHKVVDRLSDRVTNWLTINEPQIFIGMGYGSGEHAPGLRMSEADQIRIAHHVMLAHGVSVRTIRERSRLTPQIGWAPVGVVCSPETESVEDIEAARQATMECSNPIWSNTWYGDAVLKGEYPEEGLARCERHLPSGWQRDLEVMNQPLDYYAFNLYRGGVARSDKNGKVEHLEIPHGIGRTTFGWEVTPESLGWAARFFHERYQLPIVVTENGMSNNDWVALDGHVHDPQRIDFTTRYLRSLSNAHDAGVPLRAYFHWSLLDNFEWARGYTQRFGLVYVDFETGERVLKDSALWYSDVIRTNGAQLGGAVKVGKVTGVSKG